MAATERAAAEVLSVQCMACPEAAAPLEQWTYSIAAQPGAGEVDVAITHCGVCGSDVHQLDDAWGAACFPLVPGHEIVGLVTQVGDGVQHLEVGQRVGIGCQRSHCGSCDNCSAKLEQLCPKITKTYAGPDADKGGFAHYIRYNATWVFPVPDGIASELAAPLLCAGITTYAPLRRHCKAGTAVGVIGIGGLGHIAIQFARAMGCVVTAISTSASKREEARGFGAETLLVSSDPAAMAQAQGSLDFILNTASGVHGMDAYLSLLKPRGVMACVGLPEKKAANMTSLFMHSLVCSEKSLVGSYLGAHAEYSEMFAFAAAHKVVPQVQTVPLAQVNEAVARCKAGTARYRMVLCMDSSGGVAGL